VNDTPKSTIFANLLVRFIMDKNVFWVSEQFGTFLLSRVHQWRDSLVEHVFTKIWINGIDFYIENCQCLAYVPSILKTALESLNYHCRGIFWGMWKRLNSGNKSPLLEPKVDVAHQLTGHDSLRKVARYRESRGKLLVKGLYHHPPSHTLPLPFHNGPFHWYDFFTHS